VTLSTIWLDFVDEFSVARDHCAFHVGQVIDALLWQKAFVLKLINHELIRILADWFAEKLILVEDDVLHVLETPRAHPCVV
jgi:hypothetical protein